MKHDKELLRRRFSRNLKTYDTLAVIQRSIADRLGRLLDDSNPSTVTRGLEIGAGTGFLTRHLVRLFPAARWIVNDLVPQSRDYLPTVTGTGNPIDFVAEDGENFVFDEDHYDLIASASTVQWFDDLPGFVQRAARGLNSGGVLALTTFGPENFREITATTGQGLDYATLGELSALCQTQGLHILAKEEWTERQLYPSPMEVLRHLRLTGVNAVASERWTHGRLRQFEADYRAAFAVPPPENSLQNSTPSPAQKSKKNGAECVTLTFHPILLIAQKP